MEQGREERKHTSDAYLPGNMSVELDMFSTYQHLMRTEKTRDNYRQANQVPSLGFGVDRKRFHQSG